MTREISRREELYASAIDRLREIRGSASGMMMLESGERSGMFIWEPSDMTAVIAADPQRGISVAPATSPAGADGAWLRKFDGALRPEWFGAIGDGIADDDAALRGMARVGRHFGALRAELEII